MPTLTKTTFDKVMRALKLPPGKSDVQVMDDTLAGFGARKFASGKQTFFVRYLVDSQVRRMSLGPASKDLLEETREKAQRIIWDARRGVDTQAIKKAKRKKGETTLGGLIEPFLAARSGDWVPTYAAEMRRYLSECWEPLHSAPVDTIHRQDVVVVLDAIAKKRGKPSADHAKAALASFFAWAIERGCCDSSPTLHVKARSTNGARERTLSEEELGMVWRALPGSGAYADIIKLLILTGQRRQEIADLTWDEIDFKKRQINLSGARTKNQRPHVVPLSRLALAILKTRSRLVGRDFVFGEGSRGFQGWSRSKRRLDADLDYLEPWTVHDIRRSVVTGMNEIGVAPHVIESAVNHVSGSKGGIAGVYNKAQYLDERRQAMEAWAEHLRTFI